METLRRSGTDLVAARRCPKLAAGYLLSVRSSLLGKPPAERRPTISYGQRTGLPSRGSQMRAQVTSSTPPAIVRTLPSPMPACIAPA